MGEIKYTTVSCFSKLSIYSVKQDSIYGGEIDGFKTWNKTMPSSWYSIVFFFSLPFNLQLNKLSKLKKAPLCSTQGYLRLHPSVDPKVGGLDLKGGCGERRVVTVAGPHSTQHFFGRGGGR